MNIYPYFMGDNAEVEQQMERWAKITMQTDLENRSKWFRGFGLHTARGSSDHATTGDAFESLERMRATMANNGDSPLWWPGRVCLDYEPGRRSFRWMDDLASERDAQRARAWMTLAATTVLDENSEVDSVWWYNCMPFPKSASERAAIVPARSVVRGHILRGWDFRSDAHYDDESARRIIYRRHEAVEIVDNWCASEDHARFEFALMIDPDPDPKIYSVILELWHADVAIWLGDNPSEQSLADTYHRFLGAAEESGKSVVFA